MELSAAEFNPWRLLRSAPASGAAHMALDAAIAEAVGAGDSPPTLRFYRYAPPCLSIGVDQEADLVDEEACAAAGWDVVRRLTNSRALLHVNDLNWSAIVPRAALGRETDEPAAYALLARGIVGGLEALGLRPNKVKTYYEDLGNPGAALFDGPSRYEITLGQRKLVGSALALTDGALLMQSTMPLAGDITRIARALFVDLPGQRMAIEGRLRYRATNLLQVAGLHVDFDSAAEKMAAGFAARLRITMTAAEPGAGELARARALETGRFATQAWWLRV